MLFFFAHSLEASSWFQQLKTKGLDQYWLKLLHYEKNWKGHYSSRVDGPLFFLHPEGKSDPEKELDATIAGFQNTQARAGYFNQPLPCAFPERFRFLKTAGLVPSHEVACSDFDEWKSGIGAQSIVLIYSSSYPNNPASIFGHTFLRFKWNGRNELLDYSASYAAHTEGETGGVLYAFRGLLGGYKGLFSFSPYYMKVNEYNNSESRDLYEYELKLQPEAVERIINHLWELYSTTYFDYYFLTENCSTIINKVLELGDSDWDLSQVNRWYYLPADSIRRVTQIPGAIEAIRYRPSLKKQFSTKLQKLDSSDYAVFQDVNNGTMAPQEIHDVKILDALIAYWDFRKREAGGKLTEANTHLLEKILRNRAQIPQRSVVEQVDYQQNGPEFGHDVTRVFLGTSTIQDTPILRLGLKSGLHDLLAKDVGFDPFSQIDFLELAVDYHADSEDVKISHIGLVNIMSLEPYTSWDPNLSWKLGVNYQPVDNLECEQCYKYDMALGMGGSLNPGTSKGIIYLIMGGFGEFSHFFEKSQRLGPFVEWGIVGNPVENYKIQWKQTIRHDAWNNDPTDFYLNSFLGQSVSWNRNWELRLLQRFISKYESVVVQTTIHEIQIGHYF
ncbi:MAG: DUF4105 domain-containing protein [SAR324 cluster bacterium]|nr:DUF4105 domain-containing protein [SAR324 cluster bacterium]